MILTAIEGIPLIRKGHNLAEIINNSIERIGIVLEKGDILVITQKIVSKAEGRMINLNSVEPSLRAKELAKILNKDPRLVELILQESNEILRATDNHIIVEHKLGFVCANAGIDHSNVHGEIGDPRDWYLLLPINPDESARQIRDKIKKISGKQIGILIIDSHGRAWRNGVIGTTIGLAGMPALVDLRGKDDLFGFKLRITQVAAADELASAASLIMGQANERIPVVHVRGFPYSLRESTANELIRAKSHDLFR